MTVEEIRELIQLVAETGIAELEVQRGENRVHIKRTVASEAHMQVPTFYPGPIQHAPVPGYAAGPSPHLESHDHADHCRHARHDVPDHVRLHGPKCGRPGRGRLPPCDA